MSVRISDEEFRKIVQDSFTITDVIRALGHVERGISYTRVGNRIKSLDIDTSHFKSRYNRGPAGKYLTSSLCGITRR